jgi:hypothetical protein
MERALGIEAKQKHLILDAKQVLGRFRNLACDWRVN